METRFPQLSITVKAGGETLGYLVIDSTIGGRACGGLRLRPDLQEAEVALLARAMTLKFGYLALPHGGAKAGVIGEAEAPPEVKRERLLAFARGIAPLLRSRGYAPHSDMGTTNADIRALLESVGLRVKRRELRGENSGYYTALSVMAGIRDGARHVGLDLSRATVAIEGFGRVGSALASLLDCARVCVVAVSTTHGAVYNPHGLDVPRLLTMSKQIGSRFVEAYPDAERLDCAALLELPVDVLCPCARHHTIHHGNAGRILAKLVVGGANNPITPEAEQTLAERSVLCLPDFVANCGGVLGGTMEFAMHSRAAIERVIGWQLGARIALLLRESEKQKRSPRDLAEEEALCRFAAMHRLAEQRRLSGRVFELGLEFHRRGWVPGGLMRRMSKPYFEKRAGEL